MRGPGRGPARLVQFAGFETIRASYPGDIGLGVIRCVWGYQKLHAGQEPAGVMERGRWLAQIYTEATALLEEKPGETPPSTSSGCATRPRCREMYRLWDAGDPQVRELWRRTRQWSLDELAAILRCSTFTSMSSSTRARWMSRARSSSTSSSRAASPTTNGQRPGDRPRG